MNVVKRQKNPSLFIGFLIFFLALTIIASVGIGPADIPISTTLSLIINKILKNTSNAIAQGETSFEVIIFYLRIPRAIQGAFVGASLAVSGVVIQSLFKNPMADPFVIGISSGAALGASIAILLGVTGLWTLPALAFAGASLATFTVYRIVKTGSGMVTETLLLSGIAVAYFLSSIVSFLLYISGEALHQILFWLMGGLWGSSWTKILVIAPTFSIVFLVLFYFSRDLNALLLGEEPAKHLGIDVELIKKIILVATSLLAGVAVAFTGTIGFVGLIIPHITRILVGPDHRILLPSSALIGASFLVWSDTLARTIIAPAEIPVGVVTSFFGAPFFLYLLQSKRRSI